MGSAESAEARRVSFEMDEEERVRVLQGIRVSGAAGGRGPEERAGGNGSRRHGDQIPGGGRWHSGAACCLKSFSTALALSVPDLFRALPGFTCRVRLVACAAARLENVHSFPILFTSLSP